MNTSISADDRKTQRRTTALIVLVGLLLLAAVYRLASLAVEARNRAEVSARAAYGSHKVVSNVGPGGPSGLHGLKGRSPFDELNLSPEQRQQIDRIMDESMPKPPPSNELASDNKPHVVRFKLPMDKILPILTPEQRTKWEALEKERQKNFAKMSPPPGGFPDGMPPPGGPGEGVLFFRKAGPPPGGDGEGGFVVHKDGPN